jgi:hypothetical protein
MAHCDAVGVNGSNRIIFHGAPHRDDAEWMFGKSRALSCSGLDRWLLVDVGPTRATSGHLIEKTIASNECE